MNEQLFILHRFETDFMKRK